MKLVNTYQNLIQSTTKSQRSKINVFVGLSGGVDSSLTAYKLKNDGFNVTAVYMLCFQTPDPKCRSKQDRADAVKVAAQLNIPIQIWDLQKQYKQKVINYFFQGYKKGLTPNPDILCNSQIKFGLFLQKALDKGADFVATGHYAQILNIETESFKLPSLPTPSCHSERSETKRRISPTPEVILEQVYKPKPPLSRDRISNITQTRLSERETLNPKQKVLNLKNSDLELISPSPDLSGNLDIRNSYLLSSGKDDNKDQSYFLCDVDPKVYNKILFPLGATLKKDNRVLAKKVNLPVATKKDSTGICFLEDIDPQKFLKTQIKEKQGDVVNKKGEVIGSHKGVSFYTIGQRHGFTINKYIGKPSYVVAKDAKTNTLVVGSKSDLNTCKLKIVNCKFRISVNNLESLVRKEKVFIRIRNLGKFEQVKKIITETPQVNLITQNPLSSIAPGQFGVIYTKLGGEKVIVGHGEIA